MSAPSQRQALGERWISRAGAWVGLGASPGALVLGAGVASRHDGPAPLLALVLACAGMAVLLWVQGRLGLIPPIGEGQDLSELAEDYFTPATRRTAGWLIAASMVGWFGFNAGLGGTALASILSLPAPVGPVLVGATALALAWGGIPRWNAFALVATGSSLLLVGLVAVRIPGETAPLTAALPAAGPGALDVAAFIGYVAVFSVRAPDFTVGLRRRADLGWSIAVLCGAVVVVSLVGVALERATGSTDVIAVLSAEPGLAAGNTLVAAAVLAPLLTSVHSGALALRSAGAIPLGTGMAGIAALGVTLGVARFDRQLLFWLALLAAALPPLIVPVAAERRWRRRGRSAHRVPVWTWASAACLAVAFVITDHPLATVVGLVTAGLLTGSWLKVRRRSPSRPAGR